MLKDQALAEQVYNSIDTAIEAEYELLKYAFEDQMPEFSEVSVLLSVMLEKIESVSENLVKEVPALSTYKAVVSILDSLNRITALMTSDRERALSKIEYELIPLTEECRANFYFWGIVSGDKEREEKYLNEDIHYLARNQYVERSVQTGEWKYDLSITVLAYNNLDYTQKCIENLMKYYPRFLRTELILINHGSEDGTREYFERVNPDKLLDIKVNGGGLSAVHRITEGKYLLSVSNDVYVQRNTIYNCYNCMISDPKAGFVVPATSNISNLQTLKCEYSNEAELEAFCLKNNICDPDKWERRTRLCDPIGLVSNELINELNPYHRYYSENSFSFPDDNLSLLCRRNGYNMYLAKDGYCHHCGSATLKNDKNTNSEEAFLKGRANFMKRYRIDPWHKPAFSYSLFESIDINKTGHVNILAINGGLGGNGLKIKELLKENVSNRDVYLKYFLTDSLYYDDVKYMGDLVQLADSIEELTHDSSKYDYIVAEDIEFGKENIAHILDLLIGKCAPKALLILEAKYSDKEMLANYRGNISGMVTVPEDEEHMWAVFKLK